MKKLLLICFLALGTIFSANSAVITKSGTIGADETWTNTNSYLLSGYVYIDSNVTVTIQPGTIIRGDKASKGTLIVRRGGKLIADGTVSQPIVFTSNQPAGSRAAGDWGGVVLCGPGQTNAPGGYAELEGAYGGFYGGGTTPYDPLTKLGYDNTFNSGTLRYVRIEFAGIALQPGQEINGLTMGGVGSGTTIDYVQVSYGGDDAFEWFGGSVNAKHLIAYGTLDDMFDTDNGYSGKLQFLYGISEPYTADVSGSNGFESDNDANGTNNTPQTSCVFSNVTILGPKYQYTDVSGTDYNSNFKRGCHIRRNSALSVFNSVFGGFPVGIYVDGAKVNANIATNLSDFENNAVFASNGANGVHPTNKTVDTSAGTGSSFNPSTFFTSGNNTEYDNASDLMLTNPYPTSGSRDPLPAVGSPLLAGALFTNSKITDAFFTPVTYQGAFGATDWTTGWTDWDPQNTVLSTFDVAEVIASAKVYPNPSSEIARIEMNLNSAAKVKIVLTDMTGRTAQEIETEGSYINEVISINRLTKGLYTINYYINDQPAKADLLMVR